MQQQQAPPAPPVTVAMVQPSGPSFLVRAVWYLFVGWWLAGLAIALAYALAVTVIGLPAALLIGNRLGTILTLRPTQQTVTSTMRDGVLVMQSQALPQRAWWLRALYFVLVGWWWSAVWLSVAYVLALLVVTLPLALWMFNRTGAALTLYRQ